MEELIWKKDNTPFGQALREKGGGRRWEKREGEEEDDDGGKYVTLGPY